MTRRQLSAVDRQGRFLGRSETRQNHSGIRRGVTLPWIPLYPAAGREDPIDDVSPSRTPQPTDHQGFGESIPKVLEKWRGPVRGEFFTTWPVTSPRSWDRPSSL